MGAGASRSCSASSRSRWRSTCTSSSRRPPAFQRLQSKRAESATTAAAPSRSPVLTVLRTHLREVALTVGAYIGINVTYYVFVTFVISYGANPAFLGLSKNTLLTAVLIGSAGQFLGLPFAGALSDRFGRRPVMMVGAAALAVFGFAFWAMVNTGSFWLITAALLIGLGFIHSLMYGVQPRSSRSASPSRCGTRESRSGSRSRP